MTKTKSAKFICFVYFEGDKLRAMSASERRTFDESSYAYDQALQKSGHYVIAEALQSPKAARTVRVRKNLTSVKAGPKAHAKEPLGGFILIRAKNISEAEKIAAGIPLAKLGSVEVRPVLEF